MSQHERALAEPGRREVFTCRHVLAGAPILFVAHDADGDWQFLCGREHAAKEGRLSCLADLLRLDPSVRSLDTMCRSQHAVRTSPRARWRVIDEREAFIERCVESPGWSVQLVPAGEDEPAFAYTIGLFHSFDQPELLIVGLELELMQVLLNSLAQRMKEGELFSAGTRVEGVIVGAPVRLRAVRGKKTFRESLGYARWFYGKKTFPVLQVLWPDRRGRFPGQRGASAWLTRRQRCA